MPGLCASPRRSRNAQAAGGRTITRMEIELNGKATTVPEGITINALLIDIGLGERRVAVEVNREVVPRSRHNQHRLQGGDHVEIVHAIGGG